MSAGSVEDDYWNLLPTLAPEDRERLNERNSDLAWRLQRLVSASPDLAVGPVYVGAYPSSGLFQATTASVRSGTVILLYEKVLDVTAAVAAIVAAVFPGRLGGENVAPDLREPDAHQLMRHVIASTESGDSFGALALKMSEPRIQLATMLTGIAINFVIAHELAHVVLGHLTGPTRRVRSKSGSALISMPSWQMEMAADARGFRMAGASYERVPLQNQYLGSVLFFEIQEMAAALRVEADPTLAYDLEDVSRMISHPPAATRRTNLITDIHPDNIFAELPTVAWLVDFIAGATGNRPRPVDPADIEQIRRFASTCDPERYNEVLAVGESHDGVTFIDTTPVYRYIEESHDQARAALAFTAGGLMSISRAQNEFFRTSLGLLYSVYRQTYLNRPNEHAEEARQFEALLRACIPDLDDILIELGRVLKGQADGA